MRLVILVLGAAALILAVTQWLDARDMADCGAAGHLPETCATALQR